MSLAAGDVTACIGNVIAVLVLQLGQESRSGLFAAAPIR
jgi:hypothetical protein